MTYLLLITGETKTAAALQASLTRGGFACSGLTLSWTVAHSSLPSGGAGDKSDTTQRALQFQMIYFFPILVFFIAFKLPAAVSLYWTAMNFFAIIHEAAVRRQAVSDGKQ